MDHTALVMLALGLLFATLQYPDQMKKLLILVLFVVGIVLSIASSSDPLEAQVSEQAQRAENETAETQTPVVQGSWTRANAWVDKHIDDLRKPDRYVLANRAIDAMKRSGMEIGSPLFIRCLDA